MRTVLIEGIKKEAKKPLFLFFRFTALVGFFPEQQ